MIAKSTQWIVVIVSGLAVQSVVGQLAYTEASTGLGTPLMEDGDTEIELGDVNGDGHVDLVSIGDHGSPNIGTPQHGLMVWLGNGAGNWSVVQSGDFGYGGVALGDANGDGFMDAGYGMHHDYSASDFGDQLLEVALGDGTAANWTPWDDGLATNGETYGMFATDFADVDNDGDLDIGSISFGCCAGVHVYRNLGNGTWTQSFGFLGGNSTNVFYFGDVNGDGNADFACGHGQGNGSVYLGNGLGGFSPADGNLPSAGNFGREGIALGDVTDDGRDDLAYVTSVGGVKVWKWVSSGVWQDLSAGLPTSGGYEQTAIADMNLDGHGDVVIFRAASPGLMVVYGGNGAGQWTQIASVQTPNSTLTPSLRAGVDVDHNGYPDIVMVANETATGRNRPRCYVETSTATQLSIFPKYPRGGEVFVAGSVRLVAWHAAVPGGMAVSVTVELSTCGADGPWSVIDSAVPNNGRYQWTVPAELVTSNGCYLRYTVTAGDVSAETSTPAAFTILGAPPGTPGDGDGDGDLDLSDYAALQADLGGPGGGRPGAACGPFDFEPDGDVDVVDFAAFQAGFTGDL